MLFDTEKYSDSVILIVIGCNFCLSLIMVVDKYSSKCKAKWKDKTKSSLGAQYHFLHTAIGKQRASLVAQRVKNLPAMQESVSSVAQSCLTLCDPIDCCMPGFPVHHQLPELAQTHVHRVADPTISSSVVPFSSCRWSFPASVSFPMSQFFASGGQSIGVWASNEYSGLISFRIDWFDVLAGQGTVKSLLQHHPGSIPGLGRCPREVNSFPL